MSDPLVFNVTLLNYYKEHPPAERRAQEIQLYHLTNDYVIINQI